MVSQAPAAGHCGRQWGCPSPTTLHFILLYKKEGSGHQGLALPANHAQRQLLNHCYLFLHTQGFQPLKTHKQAVLKSSTFKGVWDPFSQRKRVAQEDAHRQGQARQASSTRQQTCQGPNAKGISQYLKLIITAFFFFFCPFFFFFSSFSS